MTQDWTRFLKNPPMTNAVGDDWTRFLKTPDRPGGVTGEGEGLDWLSNMSRPRSTMQLGRRQMQAEMQAETELRRNEALFQSLGKAEEFERYVESEGRPGVMGQVWDSAETAITPVFDLLSIGNYTVAGGVQEALRTGSAWAGFKQAAREFGNALPGVEIEGAKRTTFQDVFGEHVSWGNEWYGWAAAFAADILLDPLTYVPAGAAVKGIRGAAKLGSKVTGIKGMGAAGRLFDVLFTPRREVKAVGEMGERLIDLMGLTENKIEQGVAKLLPKVDQLVSWMEPQERQLFGLLFDRPDELGKVFRTMESEGLIQAGRAKKLEEHVGVVKEYLDELFQGELAPGTTHIGGLIDKHMFRNPYMPARTPIDPRMQKAWQQVARERGKVQGAVLGAGQPFGPAQPRKTRTLVDRIEAALSGDLRDKKGNMLGTEFDLGNILRLRTVEHVRGVESRRFLDSVVDGSIGALVEPEGWQKYAGKQGKWERFKASVRRDAPGYDVLEIKETRMKVVRKTKDGKLVRKPKQVISRAYVLPEPIVNYINKGEAMFESDSSLSTFFTTLNKMTSVWKGWATLSTGFHIRNYTSMQFNNWLAGVDGHKLLLRNAQAFKLQCLAEGQGKLPVPVAKAVKRLWGGIDQIPMPKIKVDGKLLSPEEIMDLAEKSGAVMSVSKLFPTPQDDVGRLVWQGVGHVMDVKDIDRLVEKGALSATAGRAMKMPLQTTMPLTETLSKTAGNKSVLLRGNRATAQMVENNGRLTLFIDRLLKGDSAIDAAKATKKWHFDYRNLTEVEKKFFSTMIPFYAWTRFAAPRMIMALAENPGKLARLPKTKRAIEQASADWRDLPTPDYYEEVQAIQLPLVMNDKPLFLQMDLPIQELNRFNKKDVLSSLHPIAKMFLETAPAGGHSFFTGAPIERFPGEEGVTGASRMTEHLAMTAFPPLGKYIRNVEARERGELGQQLLSEFGGVRVRTLDVRRVLRAQTFQRRKLSRDFRRRLVQAGELPAEL